MAHRYHINPKIAKVFSSQDVSNMTASWNDSKNKSFLKLFKLRVKLRNPD
jgi:hypothetical protein